MTTTQAAPATHVDLSTLDVLRRQVAGPVLEPGDAGYEEEVASFNQIVSHRPPIVVGAICSDDVAATVRFAVQHGLAVAVQSTGHGASFPVEDGVLISTRRMTSVSIDVQRGVARIGAGAKGAAVIEAAAPYGLAPLSGSTSDVGAVGYTLGGGMGPLGRRYGFSAHPVPSVGVVTGARPRPAAATASPPTGSARWRSSPATAGCAPSRPTTTPACSGASAAARATSASSPRSRSTWCCSPGCTAARCSSTARTARR